jgi:hypothetical protein
MVTNYAFEPQAILLITAVINTVGIKKNDISWVINVISAIFEAFICLCLIAIEKYLLRSDFLRASFSLEIVQRETRISLRKTLFGLSSELKSVHNRRNSRQLFEQ